MYKDEITYNDSEDNKGLKYTSQEQKKPGRFWIRIGSIWGHSEFISTLVYKPK